MHPSKEATTSETVKEKPRTVLIDISDDTEIKDPVAKHPTNTKREENKIDKTCSIFSNEMEIKVVNLGEAPEHEKEPVKNTQTDCTLKVVDVKKIMKVPPLNKLVQPEKSLKTNPSPISLKPNASTTASSSCPQQNPNNNLAQSPKKFIRIPAAALTKPRLLAPKLVNYIVSPTINTFPVYRVPVIATTNPVFKTVTSVNNSEVNFTANNLPCTEAKIIENGKGIKYVPIKQKISDNILKNIMQGTSQSFVINK